MHILQVLSIRLSQNLGEWGPESVATSFPGDSDVSAGSSIHKYFLHSSVDPKPETPPLLCPALDPASRNTSCALH